MTVVAIADQPNKTYPTLWFGTYAYVCAYILYIPPLPAAGGADTAAAAAGVPPAPEARTRADKGKEITFKQHKAPIVGITVFDVPTGLPLDQAIARTGAGGHSDAAAVAERLAKSPHRVAIATEEQFKVFSLPELSVKDKYKLTAKEGVRIRRMQFARFSSAAPPAGGPAAVAADATAVVPAAANRHHETGMLCLTNAGDCIIFSVPDLKKKLNAAAVRREDIK